MCSIWTKSLIVNISQHTKQSVISASVTEQFCSLQLSLSLQFVHVQVVSAPKQTEKSKLNACEQLTTQQTAARVQRCQGSKQPLLFSLLANYCLKFLIYINLNLLHKFSVSVNEPLSTYKKQLQILESQDIHCVLFLVELSIVVSASFHCCMFNCRTIH